MEYYAGIDVSLEESSVCVIDGSGVVLREAKVLSEPVLYFVRGPAQLGPTVIGKITNFATSVVLLFIGITFLVSAPWSALKWMEVSIWCLQILVSVNILYLLYLGLVWKGPEKIANATPGN